MPKLPLYPRTSNEWWTFLDHHWDNLLDILEVQIDCRAPAYWPPGKPEGGNLTNRIVSQELRRLKSERNPEIARYLSAAWGLASEAYARSCVPGWSALCALLSEEEVLYNAQP